MTTSHPEYQAEPFFITEEVEVELIAAGHVFEPPGHVSTKHLPQILAGLTDAELTTWPIELSEEEIGRRSCGAEAISGALHGKS